MIVRNYIALASPRTQLVLLALLLIIPGRVVSQELDQIEPKDDERQVQDDNFVNHEEARECFKIFKSRVASSSLYNTKDELTDEQRACRFDIFDIKNGGIPSSCSPGFLTKERLNEVSSIRASFQQCLELAGENFEEEGIAESAQ